MTEEERLRAQVVLREMEQERESRRLGLSRLDPFEASPLRQLADLGVRFCPALAVVYAWDQMSRITPAGRWIMLLILCFAVVPVWDYVSMRRAVVRLNQKVDAIRELLEERSTAR